MIVPALAVRRSGLVLVLLALGACGSSGATDGGDGGSCTSSPSRTPQQCGSTPCEGTQCTLVDGGGTSNCPGGLSCADWSSYAQGFGICRIPCGQGCPSGETCTPDQGGTSTESCQCTPAEAPCGSGDSCASLGLECNPDFHVCAAPMTTTSCPSGLSYSSLWKLCLGS